MSVSFLPTAGITQYLPAACQEKVPVLSPKTTELFQSIQPNDTQLENIRSLDSYVSDLTDTAKALEEGKKRETLHKVLSILSLATCIAAIAGVILLCIFVAPAVPALFVLPAVLLLAIIATGGSHDFIEKFRTYKKLEFNCDSVGTKLLIMTLGLSAPIHYIYAAFTRRKSLETQLETLVEGAKKDNSSMQNYIQANSEKLQKSLTQKLQECECDLAKLKELASPLKIEERQLQIKIDDLKKALAELEALVTFYQ